jgi:hypothetical protein
MASPAVGPAPLGETCQQRPYCSLFVVLFLSVLGLGMVSLAPALQFVESIGTR